MKYLNQSFPTGQPGDRNAGWITQSGRTLAKGLCFLVLFLTASTIYAQPGLIGSETQVNTTTSNTQEHPAIAMDSSGNGVIVWESWQNANNGFKVMAQRIDITGVAQGSEFQVNTTNGNNDQFADVAMAEGGAFVVVWMSDAQDGDGWGVYGQRYLATGVADGTEFLINTTTAGSQKHPRVDMDADGGFVVVWTDENEDGSDFGIFAQRFNSAGVAQGTEFQVNDSTSEYQGHPDVAMATTGEFVITWQSNGTDGSDHGVYFQRYDAAGAQQGDMTLANGTTSASQQAPSIGMDGSSNFIIAWNSYGQDGDNLGIYARRFDATGTALSGEFQVNDTTTGGQDHADVAVAADGPFVISWSSYGEDGSFYGVFLKQYDAAGIVNGQAFQGNTRSTDFQQASRAAWFDSGLNFIVTWMDGLENSSSTQDGSDYGIYLQTFTSGGYLTAVCQDVTLYLDANGSVTLDPADLDGGSTSSDAGITFSTNQTIFSCSDIGTNTAQLNALSSNGRTASCSATVTILDSLTPVLTCPTNLTVSNDIGSCDAIVNYTEPTASDNCAALTNTSAVEYNGHFYLLVSTSATWAAASLDAAAQGGYLATVNDAAENTFLANLSTNNLWIGYNDEASEGNFVWANGETSTYTNWNSNEPNNSGSGEDYALIRGDDTWNDASSTSTQRYVIEFDQLVNPTLQSGLGAGGTFSLGTHTEVWEVTDESGNSTTCSFSITVEDTEDPVFNCPFDITAASDTGSCDAVVNYAVSATDNCTGETLSMISGLPSGSTFPLGTTTQIFSVADAVGNTVSCVFDVIVVDYEAPVVNCPSNITVNASSGSCDATATFSVSTSDNCTGETLAQTVGLSSGSAFPTGITTNTFTVTDASGNTDDCSFTVTVIDADPVALCQDQVVYLDANGNASISASDINNGSSDNCGIASISLSDSTWDCGGTVATMDDFTALNFDGSNDGATISNGLPAMSELTYEVWLYRESSNSGLDAILNHTGWSNGKVHFQLEGTTRLGFGLYGNTPRGQWFNYRVPNFQWTHVALVYSSSGQYVKLYVNGTLYETKTYTTAISTIGGVSMNMGEFSSSRRYDGNMDEFRVWSEARSEEEIQQNMHRELAGSEANLEAYWNFNEGTCGGSNTGITTLTDQTGNGHNGSMSNFALSGCSSNFVCAESCDYPINQIGTGGGNTVTLTATDVNGNTGSCTAEVVVMDNIAPVVTCPADITVTAGAGDCDIAVSFSDPTATDNCTPGFIKDVQILNGHSYEWGGSISSWTNARNAATAAGGYLVVIGSQTENDMVRAMGTGSMWIGLADNASEGNYAWVNGESLSYTNWNSNEPNASRWNADYIEMYNSGKWNDRKNSANRQHVIEYDEIMGNIELSSGLESGDLFPVGVTSVTYQATDEHGNIGYCSFNVTVNDNGCGTSAPQTNDKPRLEEAEGNDLEALVVESPEDALEEGMDIMAYPNPFQATTTLRFRLPEASDVVVEVYSLQGVKIATLFEGAVEAGVEEEVTFKPNRVTAGIYYYRLTTTTGVVKSGKLIYQP